MILSHCCCVGDIAGLGVRLSVVVSMLAARHPSATPGFVLWSHTIVLKPRTAEGVTPRIFPFVCSVCGYTVSLPRSQTAVTLLSSETKKSDFKLCLVSKQVVFSLDELIKKAISCPV